MARNSSIAPEWATAFDETDAFRSDLEKTLRPLGPAINLPTHRWLKEYLQDRIRVLDAATSGLRVLKGNLQRRARLFEEMQRRHFSAVGVSPNPSDPQSRGRASADPPAEVPPPTTSSPEPSAPPSTPPRQVGRPSLEQYILKAVIELGTERAFKPEHTRKEIFAAIARRVQKLVKGRGQIIACSNATIYNVFRTHKIDFRKLRSR